MNSPITWLRDANECNYAADYLERKVNRRERDCIGKTDIYLNQRSDNRRVAEAWIHALSAADHTRIITRLQGNLRQRRLPKSTNQRRLNLSDEACKALKKLTIEHGKSPSETVSILLLNSPEQIEALRDKWNAEQKRKTDSYLFESLRLKQSLKTKNLEIRELHKHLRQHIRALEMWKSSMGDDVPPFEEEPELLDNDVNNLLERLLKAVDKQVQLLKSLPE